MITLFSNCKCVELEIWVFVFTLPTWWVYEDLKIPGVNRIYKSKKDRQQNGQKKKSKMTSNDIQNINLYRMFYFNLWIKRKYPIKCVPVKRLETQLIFFQYLGARQPKLFNNIVTIWLRRTFVLIMITLFSNCKCVKLEIWVFVFTLPKWWVYEDLKIPRG